MGVAMTRPAKHLVHNRLNEEDEEESQAEEELGEGILQLQHRRRHHTQPCGSLQGLPHLGEEKFERKFNLLCFSPTSPNMWMNTVEMRTPPPKHNTIPANNQAVNGNSELDTNTLPPFKKWQCDSATMPFSSFHTCARLMA